MKTLDEIEAILKEYSSGPIVAIAAKDALKWAKTWERLAHKYNGIAYDGSTLNEDLEAEAEKIAETME